MRLQDIARRLRDGLAAHPEVGGQPADFRLPGQLDQAVGSGIDEHVGIGRRHVEPCGEAGETGAVLLHVGDRRGRHQLGALVPNRSV